MRELCGLLGGDGMVRLRLTMTQRHGDRRWRRRLNRKAGCIPASGKSCFLAR